MNVYLIGSLSNREAIQDIAEELRSYGHSVFDDWLAPGPEADKMWREFSVYRGQSYAEALKDRAAQHIFEWDKEHLDEADAVVLVLPAGKSGHLELGYAVGSGKVGYILLDGNESWDVMYAFADRVFTTRGELYQEFDPS